MEEVESPQAFLRKSPISVVSARTPVQVLHPLLLCPHVNSPRQTGLSVRTRATRRLDWGPSTSLRSSDPPVSLVNGHVRRLHQQPGVNYKTDSAHCAFRSVSLSTLRPTRRTAPPVRPLNPKTDKAHCAFCSALPSSTTPTTCTARLVRQLQD